MTRLEDLYALRAVLAAQIVHAEALKAETTPAVTGEKQWPRLDSAKSLEVVAELYGVTPDRILSRSQDAQVTKARQAVCWLLRAQGLSLPWIGRIVGRDHSTVLYACRKIEADPATRALLWPLVGRAA